MTRNALISGKAAVTFGVLLLAGAAGRPALGQAAASRAADAGRAASTTRPATGPATTQEAVKEVDRQELVEGLLGKSEAGDEMGRVVARMRKVYEQLAQRYDAGLVTQEIQRRIVDDLAKAIEEARRQMQQPPPSQTQPSEKDQDKDAKPKERNDERQAAQQARQQTEKEQAEARQAQNPKPATRDMGGRPEQPARAGKIEETRRGWGNIPPRDRDEVVQGAGEEIIGKYKRQVDRYYEALSNQD